MVDVHVLGDGHLHSEASRHCSLSVLQPLGLWSSPCNPPPRANRANTPKLDIFPNHSTVMGPESCVG
jgi:hypothetical protein